MSDDERKIKKLVNISTKIGSGITPRGGDKVYTKTGVHLIRSQNIYDFVFDFNGLVCIDDMQADKMKNVEVQSEDILLNITGDSVARCCQVPEKVLPARVNQHVSIVRPKKEEILPKYLLYYLVSYESKEKMLSLAYTGGTRKALTKSMIENLNIKVPSLVEQKAIATTLSCLDDKIELNNRINKTFEEMAQAIFKSYFVDFEPFQDGEFEDSELGRIPKGWKLKSLYAFAEYINGTSFKKDEYKDYGLPIVKITELKNGITDNTQYFNGNKDKKYYIKTGDILFSWSGSPQTSIDTFIWVGGDAILNQHTFKIKIKNNDYSFIYLLLKFFKPEFIRIAIGKQTTGLGHVTNGDLKRLQFPYNQKIVANCCQMLDPLVQKYKDNLIENETLMTLRDTLLPKLMDGELRVPINDEQHSRLINKDR